MKRPGQGRVGDHHIEPLESRRAREQIPIRRMQSVRVAGAIANGNDDVPERAIRAGRKNRGPHRVLVHATGSSASLLEFAKRGGKESCLPDQSVRAAIRTRASLEACHGQPLEIVYRFLMTVDQIEKFQHRRDERRPDTERRVGATLYSGAARHSEQRFALRGDVGRDARLQPLEQPPVKLGARNEIRKHNGAGGRDHPVLDGADQMSRGRARWDNDQAIAGIERRAIDRERGQCASEGLEIRRPHESRRAGCDH